MKDKYIQGEVAQQELSDLGRGNHASRKTSVI
jgi:hypothetical protein